MVNALGSPMSAFPFMNPLILSLNQMEVNQQSTSRQLLSEKAKPFHLKETS